MRNLFVLIVAIALVAYIPTKAFAENSTGKLYQWSTPTNITTIPNLAGFTDISTGTNHSLALKSDGTVWAWGENSDAQLGDGSLNYSANPIQVKGSEGIGFLTDIKAIAAGDRYSMALKSNGTILTWGENGFGLRGTGIDVANNNAAPLKYPTPVKGSSNSLLTNIVMIAAGDNHSLALKSDGTLLSWGSNGSGQLGLGCSSAPGSSCSNKFLPTQILNLDNVVYIASGRLHNLIIKGDNTVWGWGRAFEGQLGNAVPGAATINTPTLIPGLINIKKVSAKYFTSTALTNTGFVYEWGNRGYNNIAGVNPRLVQNLSNVLSIGAGRDDSFAVKSDGTVWQWHSDNIIAQQVIGLSNILTVEGRINTLNLVLEKYNPPPPVSPTPAPFLELPWNYEADGNDFSTAALAINSFFDHGYPLLSDINDIPEPAASQGSVLTFFGFPSNSTISYSSHDGYDWGKPAEVLLGDDVLAAASGTAEFRNSCGACGNMIIIDHKNGYQTKYMHLLNKGIFEFNPTAKIEVESGQKIGEVGSTGHSTGVHLHFGVFEDKNNDGNFGDNFTDGATDPFGWHSKETDPWSIFEFVQNGIQKIGNKSYYLWKDKIEDLKETLEAAGGIIELNNFKFEFPQDAVQEEVEIEVKPGPIVNPSKQISSIGNRVIVFAYDKNGSTVTSFSKPFSLTIDFSNNELSRYDLSTISLYSSSDGVEWNKESTNVNLATKKATSQINHFTHFALMAERLDTTAPTTEAVATGDEGADNWFRSDVVIDLIAQDNEGGLGVDFTTFNTNGLDWQIYSNSLPYDNEGEYEINFYSVDNDENVEELKSYKFHIDKTYPEVSLSVDKTVFWPPNGKLVPVRITGTSSDENLTNSWVTVQDEYGEIGPMVTTFNQTIYLPATRHDDDLNGRTFTITAKAEDKAGNLSTSIKKIIVPHDQSRN